MGRPERVWGGGQTDGRTDGRTDKSPLCSTGLRPLRGRCPASHSDLQPCKTGQRVSLTTYCPWATCFFFFLSFIFFLFLLFFFLYFCFVFSSFVDFDRAHASNFALSFA